VLHGQMAKAEPSDYLESPEHREFPGGGPRGDPRLSAFRLKATGGGGWSCIPRRYKTTRKHALIGGDFGGSLPSTSTIVPDG
jgi:hypothetical protein